MEQAFQEKGYGVFRSNSQQPCKSLAETCNSGNDQNPNPPQNIQNPDGYSQLVAEPGPKQNQRFQQPYEI